MFRSISEWFRDKRDDFRDDLDTLIGLCIIAYVTSLIDESLHRAAMRRETEAVVQGAATAMREHLGAAK
jgi:hypothetical protein